MGYLNTFFKYFVHIFLHIFLIEIDKIQLSKTCASIFFFLVWLNSFYFFLQRYLNHLHSKSTSLIDGEFSRTNLLESILKRFYFSPQSWFGTTHPRTLFRYRRVLHQLLNVQINRRLSVS